MNLPLPTYIPRDSPVHRCDARVKLGLLLAYSVTLFFLHSWMGMGLAAAALAIAIAASRLPMRSIVAPLAPLYVLAAITVGLSYLNGNGIGASGWQALNGALLMGARIVLLAWASLVLTYSTTSSQLMNALSSILRPFRRIGVPADDIALALSLALRFIPLIAQQMHLVRNAQYSRGAKFGEGPLNSIKAWCGTLIPVLVGLFRQGETLACAMEARCYGAPPSKRGGRTLLNRRPFTIGDMTVLVAGIAACALAAFFL